MTGTPFLELDALSVAFERPDATLLALDRVSLTVAEGEFVCVVGASGCGKTTLLRSIAGLVPPTEGAVRLRGRPARPAGGDMAMVFQQDALFPWRTVLDNVRFGLDVAAGPGLPGLPGRPRRGRAEADDRARDAIERVGLGRFAGHYPHELSGGMRQRVNLARALAVGPQVLLMDEPFAALDAQTREVMQAELLGIWSQQRTTVVFITHQIDEAVLLGDRVVVMATHPGRVREEVPVPIDRPRDLHTKRTPAFVAIVDHVWSLIEAEVRRSMLLPTT